jgi:hypothetical protein
VVIQFRLHSLPLNVDKADLARAIHGSRVPNIKCYGLLGDSNRQPLLVYSLSRIPGISYLEFQLDKQLIYADNSEELFKLRKDLGIDLAG